MFFQLYVFAFNVFCVRFLRPDKKNFPLFSPCEGGAPPLVFELERSVSSRFLPYLNCFCELAIVSL